MSQPFYHLRPNKYVDRHLFVNTLERLMQIINIKDHRYIGFGSYLFDDFKLFHNKLNIDTMISLENDEENFKRAKYNVPYNCICVTNQSSTDYISNGDWGDINSIIWLDYTSPKQLGQQFSDIVSLTNILLPHDIVRVTLNANADSLGSLGKNGEDKETGLQKRFDKFKARMGDYAPADISADDFSKDSYPILLLKCLKFILSKSYRETAVDKKFFLPLFSTVYQDGEHKMLTFTGIILDDHDEEAKIRDIFDDMSFVNFQWDKPSQIKIPDLTIKEMIEINKLLPGADAEEQISRDFDFVFCGQQCEVNSYISFYKYYPSFQSVNF